jgi:cholesterol oxidase
MSGAGSQNKSYITRLLGSPMLVMTGENNYIFTDLNIEFHKRFEAIVPGRHELHVFPRCGHQHFWVGGIAQ